MFAISRLIILISIPDVTETFPAGLYWQNITFQHGTVAQVSVYENRVWLTTDTFKVWTTPLASP